MSRVYAMESGFLARLLADRKELLAIARSFRTAEEMREARNDLLASARINITPKAGADPRTLYTVDADGVAHIPVIGELTPAAQTDICGAYTAEALTEYGFITAAAMAADEDMRVSEIAFDVDSPGGYLDGLDQTAQVLAGLTKPTRSNVSNMAASAAYWLASQTDRIVASSPADVIGSIGVAVDIWDNKKALEAMGYTHEVLTSTDAPDKRPDITTDEGKAKIISLLDATHAVFVQRVSTGRGVSAEKVKADFGHGGLLLAAAAKSAGMIDGFTGETLSRPRAERTAGVAGVAAKAANSKSTEVRKMDLTMLKAEHPEVYKAAKAEGYTEGMGAGVTQGVTEERKRLEGLNAFRGINADGDKAVDEAIRSGKSYTDAAPLIAAATAKGKGKNADGDNPPDVATAAQLAAGGAGMSAEDRAWYLEHGVKAAELDQIAADTAKEKK